jgi:hypothetical protein
MTQHERRLISDRSSYNLSIRQTSLGAVECHVARIEMTSFRELPRRRAFDHEQAADPYLPLHHGVSRRDLTLTRNRRTIIASNVQR